MCVKVRSYWLAYWQPIASVFAPLILMMAGAATVGAQGAPNPVPMIVQPLSPSSVPPVSSPFGLTVNGTGFVRGAQVNWNGSARVTSFLSSSRLVAIISGVDVATAGTAAITVTNPSPGGGVSNSVSFNIANPITSFVFSNLTWHGAPGIGPLIGADFNGDGKLDLAVSVDSLQLGGPTQLSILLGNGDGTFKDSITYAIDSDLSAPIVADFNGDGKLDLAVASSHDDTVSILLGNGDGTFQSPLIFTVGHTGGTVTGPVALIAGDFNRDGKLDLAFALQFSDTVGILPGNGDGTFGALVEFPANNAPTGITSGDFNGDGILDLALSGPGAISILLGNGDGTFQRQHSVPVNSGIMGLPSVLVNLFAADLNADGKLDLIATEDNGFGEAGFTVLMGNGNGAFQPNVNYTDDTSATQAVVADLNANGKLDVALLHDSARELSIFLGNGDGTFQTELAFVTGNLPDGGSSTMVAGDFNNDGKIDLALPFVSSASGASLTMLLQGQFPALSYPATVDFGTPPIGIAASITVTLLNTGLANFAITNLAVSGPNAANFSIDQNTCVTTLAPSATCTFIVDFTPNTPATFTAAITITDNAPGAPHTIQLTGATADGPALVLSSSSISFAGQAVGTTSPSQSVTLTSAGTTDLTITQISLTGINPTDFTATNTCSPSLTVGASCQINVAFKPTATGPRVADVTISHNGLGSPQAIHLTGSPLSGPGIVIAPPAVNFATQIMGVPSSVQTITLISAGTASVAMSGITLTGANAGDYAEMTTCTPILEVDSSCQLSITFTPTFIGTSTATLQISDNTPVSPHSIALTGLGQAAPTPMGSVSPASLAYGSQTVGTTSAAQILTVTNVGTESLTVTGPTISGANPADFSFSSFTCKNILLQPAATCKVSVIFGPLAAGSRTATVNISSNSSTGPLTVSLTGAAIAAPLPGATVVPSTITFSSQVVGTSGLPQNVTLTNIGNATFNIASIAASTADFGQINSCGASLAAGATCSIGVFFDPTVSGSRTGTLIITDGAANSPQTVSLSGTGEDFSVAAASQSMATVKAGEAAIYMLTLAPDGGFNQPVTFTCTGAPAQSSCVVSPNPAVLSGSAATSHRDGNNHSRLAAGKPAPTAWTMDTTIDRPA